MTSLHPNLLLNTLFRFCLLLTLFSLPMFAQAAKITVSAEGESQLELRTVALPGGGDVEYVIISGQPVTLKIDETDQIIANLIEFDRTNNVVRIIGFGTIITEDQRTDGNNLEFQIEDETFQGTDVLIVTTEIDVLGADASRVPGQISVASGEFSPCGRCGQDVQDYSFKAGRLEIYPGDRLVAFDVDVLFHDIPLLFLPLLVVPLGPPDRQPQLSITTGTETSRAEVFLTWPYVAGSSALGSVTLRYYADIEPGTADFFTNSFLGGTVLTNYLGGEVNHQFFTPEGKGTFDLAFTPAFITNRETGDKTTEQFKVRFEYNTEESLNIPQTNFSISRDDATRNRVTEFNVRMSNSVSGIKGTVTSRGFIDFDPSDDVDTPSFGSPRRSIELDLVPESESFTIGPFTASGIRLNLGFFQAISNSANRSAAISPVQTAGRILETHTVRLEPLNPWSGLEINASTNFSGQYYTTGERLVNWTTSASASQTFGIGSFRLNFERNINEGETPFAFDTRSLGNTSFLGGDFTLTPFDWLRFNSSTRYVLLNDRSRDAEGFDPLTTSLTLFSNLSWINLSFSNSYDFEEDSFDPGNITTEFSLNSPDPGVEARLNVTLVNDLDPDYPDRLGTDNDQSELDVSFNFGVRPFMVFDLSGGYTFDPPEPEEDQERAFRKDLVLGVTFGTEDQQDLIPSLRLGLTRDLNNQETKSFSLNATAAIQPVEATLNQSFDVPNKQLGASEYSVTWNGIARFQANGFALIQPGWLGFELTEDRREDWSFSLAENRNSGESRWSVTYRTTRIFGDLAVSGACAREEGDPNPKSCNSNLQSFVNLDETRLGDFYFGVDFNSTLIVQDDAQPLTYLDLANLNFFLDIAATFGLQGTLELASDTNTEGSEIISSTLKFDQFAVTYKLLNQLYLSAILNETWTIINTAGDTSFNLQPEFRVTWDRCCWALYSSWDSKTGKISITLTTPGGTEGLGGVFEDTPLKLPGESQDTGGTGGS